MNHFPIFLNTAGRRIVLSGGGDAALAKAPLVAQDNGAADGFCPHARCSNFGLV